MNGDVHSVKTPRVGTAVGTIQGKAQEDNGPPASKKIGKEGTRQRAEISCVRVEGVDVVVEYESTAEHWRIGHCREEERHCQNKPAGLP
jgi:hypothetical protein